MDYLLHKIEEAQLELTEHNNKIKALRNEKKKALTNVTDEVQITKINKDFDLKIRDSERAIEQLNGDITHYKVRMSYFYTSRSEKERIEQEQNDVNQKRDAIQHQIDKMTERRNKVQKKIKEQYQKYMYWNLTQAEADKRTFLSKRHSKDLTLQIIRNRQELRRLDEWEKNLNARRRDLEEQPLEEGGVEIDEDEDEDIPSDIEELRERCEDCDKMMDLCETCKQTYCEECEGIECKICKRKVCPWCAYQDELCYECRKKRRKKKKKKKKRANMSIPNAILDVLSDAEDWMTAREITREIKRRRLVKKGVLEGKTPEKSVRREITTNKKTYEIHPKISGLYKLRGRSFEDETVDMAIPRTLVPEVINLIEDEDPELPPLLPERSLDDIETITGEKRKRDEDDDDEDDEEREKKKRKLEALIKAYVKAGKMRTIKRIRAILTQVTSKYKLVKK
jgi:chromosome segregation ATPase